MFWWNAVWYSCYLLVDDSTLEVLEIPDQQYVVMLNLELNSWSIYFMICNNLKKSSTSH